MRPFSVPLLLGALNALGKSIELRSSANAPLDDELVTFHGWTSWSLQAFQKPGYGADWFNEANIMKQADALAQYFKDAGYTQVNLDSGWQDDNLDQYGRPQLHKVRFPSGMEHLLSYLKERGLKLGLFYLPGVDSRAVEKKMPVFGTSYTADQIVLCPTNAKPGCQRPPANAFGAGYALDFSHPGAQGYIDSLVDQLYRWEVTFVKYAGYVPGSSVDPNDKNFAGASSAADLAAWRSAIDRLHATRYSNKSKIWLSAAWEIPKSQKDILKANADSHRVAIDIAAYSTVMTTFDRVIRNALVAASWSSVAANRGGATLDLDAILLADLSLTESKTMATLWALCGTPFYSGDDLTTLQPGRRFFLTNPRVLAMAKQLSRNPAQLLDYQQHIAAHAKQSSVSQAGKESVSQCDARGLKELHQHVCKSLHVKPLEVGTVSSLSAMGATDGNLPSAAVSMNGGASANSPGSQVWFAETTDSNSQVIYLAFINAGNQLTSDGPATIKADLSKLGLKSQLAESYTITDLWTGEQVGTVSGNLVVSSGTLQAHNSVLYALKPVARA